MTESSMVPLPKGELARFENSFVTLRGEQAEALDTLSTFEFETVQVDSTGSVVQRQAKTARYFREDLGHGVMLDMVSIPDGKFKMGSPEDEAGREECEGPQHWVKVPPFFMGKYPVTQAQWRAVATFLRGEQHLDADPSFFKGDNRPVERVSWEDVTEFCVRLSQQTGKTYRLPSETEWEYACRARTETPFHYGERITTDLGNYRGYTDSSRISADFFVEKERLFREQTTNVGSFSPNSFGLFDMHGNVWEWCLDSWHNNYKGGPKNRAAWLENGDDLYRLLRGGSWLYPAVNCSSSHRGRFVAQAEGRDIGFRIVCTSISTNI